ncbi:hypothetical protein EON73_00605 [bacterium]|nr:MAG: hypothetical protein EON73_00605 [bacterium]
MQTFGLQALQSKALYGGKTTRRRRQNYVLQAIQSLQSEALYKLCKASHRKEAKVEQTFCTP